MVGTHELTQMIPKIKISIFKFFQKKKRAEKTANLNRYSKCNLLKRKERYSRQQFRRFQCAVVPSLMWKDQVPIIHCPNWKVSLLPEKYIITKNKNME